MVVINNRDTLCHDLYCKQSTVSLHRRYSVYSAHEVHYAETLWQVALCGQSTVSLHSKAHVPTQHRQHSVYSAHKVHYAETLWQVALCGKSVVSLNRRYSVYSAHKVHYAETVWNVVGFNATNLQLNFTSFNFSTKYTPPPPIWLILCHRPAVMISFYINHITICLSQNDLKVLPLPTSAPRCVFAQLCVSTRAFAETKPRVHIVVFGNEVIWRNVNM